MKQSISKKEDFQKSAQAINGTSAVQKNAKRRIPFVDNRPEAIIQRQLQEQVNAHAARQNSAFSFVDKRPKIAIQRQLQAKADAYSAKSAAMPIEKTLVQRQVSNELIPGRLNVVGEIHDKLPKLREKLFCKEKMEDPALPFAYEYKFGSEARKSDKEPVPFADPMPLRLKQLVAFINVEQLKMSDWWASEASIEKMKLYCTNILGTALLIASVLDERETSFVDIASNIEKINDITRAMIAELDIKNFNFLKKKNLKKNLAPKVEELQKLIGEDFKENESDAITQDNRLSEERSMYMFEAANNRKAYSAVWKIGNSHAEDMKNWDHNYVLILKDSFEKAYYEWEAAQND